MMGEELKHCTKCKEVKPECRRICKDCKKYRRSQKQLSLTEKKCHACGLVKSIDNFIGILRKASNCKDCFKKITAEYRKSDRFKELRRADLDRMAERHSFLKEKECSHCKKVKDIKCFVGRKVKTSACKECRNKRRKELLEDPLKKQSVSQSRDKFFKRNPNYASEYEKKSIEVMSDVYIRKLTKKTNGTVPKELENVFFTVKRCEILNLRIRKQLNKKVK